MLKRMVIAAVLVVVFATAALASGDLHNVSRSSDNPVESADVSDNGGTIVAHITALGSSMSSAYQVVCYKNDQELSAGSLAEAIAIAKSLCSD